MKKNLLTFVVLGASVALLAGCTTKTPEVEEQTGAIVEETVTTEVTPTTDTGVTTDTTVETTVDTTATGTAE